MRQRQAIQRLWKDEGGATIVEFAIVSIPLFYLIIGVIEFGLLSYTRIAVESALTQAGRAATIGGISAGSGCADRVCSVRWEVERRVHALPNGSRASVVAEVVSNPGISPTQPRDVCLVDPADPYPATCAGSYQENTGNTVYDPPTGGLSVGDAGELVEIRVNFPWTIATPFIGQFFPPNGVFMINDTVVVKNEPFAP